MYAIHTGLGHYPFEHREKPRRHPRDVGDILMQRGLDESRQLGGPVGHQCHALGGDTHSLGQRIYAVDKCGRQVADTHPGRKRQFIGITAAEDETLAREETAVGI